MSGPKSAGQVAAQAMDGYGDLLILKALTLATLLIITALPVGAG